MITCVAGFRPEKNHLGLLKSFSALDNATFNPYLLLAGDGPERQKAEAFAAKRGLKQRVIFLGNVEDIRPVLSASDLTVIASTAIETFSIAMLESMAMARPVITTDIGGQREAIIDGETGKVVPIGDLGALADAMGECLGDLDKVKTMGKKAREKVIREFSVEEMVRQTERVLEEALRDG